MLDAGERRRAARFHFDQADLITTICMPAGYAVVAYAGV
jgi:hypothetical protein